MLTAASGRYTNTVAVLTAFAFRGTKGNIVDFRSAKVASDTASAGSVFTAFAFRGAKVVEHLARAIEQLLGPWQGFSAYSYLRHARLA